MEVLFILAMLIPTIIMAIFKVWALFWVFTIFDVCFGAVEVVSKVKTGKTISQHFWEYSTKNQKKAIVVLGSMGLMWVALLWHLGSKMLKKEVD